MPLGAYPLLEYKRKFKIFTAKGRVDAKSQSMLGLTSHSLMITAKRRHIVKPEAFAGHYLQVDFGWGRCPEGPGGGGLMEKYTSKSNIKSRNLYICLLKLILKTSQKISNLS